MKQYTYDRSYVLKDGTVKKYKATYKKKANSSYMTQERKAEINKIIDSVINSGPPRMKGADVHEAACKIDKDIALWYVRKYLCNINYYNRSTYSPPNIVLNLSDTLMPTNP